MDVKLSLCYVVLLLFSLCSAEDLELIVKRVTSIGTTDDNFVCATIDWWPADKCDYDQCPWGKAGILNLVLIFHFISQSRVFFFICRNQIRMSKNLQ